MCEIPGSKITVTSHPASVLLGLTEQLTVRCDVRDTSASATIVGRRDVTQTVDNVEEVTSIILMMNGQDVASVTNLAAAQVKDGSLNSQVTGQVSSSASGGTGFLEVTFTDPIDYQAGEYHCEANGLSQGHGVVFSTSLEVSSAAPNVSDLLGVIRDMGEEIHRLQQAVAFSVGYNVTGRFNKGDVVQFNQVLTNVGGGYNESSGEFVCPVSGLYEFEIHALTDDGRIFFFSLQQNDVTKVTIYGTSSSFQGSSNSAILKVKQGDVLKVVAEDKSYVYATDRETYTTFSGHLLNVL